MQENQNVVSVTERLDIDIVTQVEQCANRHDVFRVADILTTRFGYRYFSIIRSPDTEDTCLSDVLLASNCPIDLIRTYDEMDLLKASPQIAALRGSTKPFQWRASDAEWQASGENSWSELFSTYRIDCGVCVPAHDVTGHRGAFLLSGQRPPHDEPELMALFYYVNLIYGRFSQITPPRIAEERDLTEREVECLQWTSEGKTSSEIATILNLSEHTINHYLAAAGRKLDAVNRVHAVSKAIRIGLLS